jgi:hypothetical protein
VIVIVIVVVVVVVVVIRILVGMLDLDRHRLRLSPKGGGLILVPGQREVDQHEQGAGANQRTAGNGRSQTHGPKLPWQSTHGAPMPWGRRRTGLKGVPWGSDGRRRDVGVARAGVAGARRAHVGEEESGLVGKNAEQMGARVTAVVASLRVLGIGAPIVRGGPSVVVPLAVLRVPRHAGRERMRGQPKVTDQHQQQHQDAHRPRRRRVAGALWGRRSIVASVASGHARSLAESAVANDTQAHGPPACVTGIARRGRHA